MSEKHTAEQEGEGSRVAAQFPVDSAGDQGQQTGEVEARPVVLHQHVNQVAEADKA